MSVFGKRRFPGIVEAAIEDKPGIKDITAETFRTDAAAILESLVAELDEHTVLGALSRQGFEANAYRSTLRTLVEIARSRRPERVTGRK